MSAQPQPTRGLYRFGPYTADPNSGELRKYGQKLKLSGQPIEILIILLERPGCVVGRDEIRERLWPDGTFVDFENSLNKSINKLRQALNDSADRPAYIETIPKRGYRFIGTLDALAGKPAFQAEGLVAPIPPGSSATPDIIKTKATHRVGRLTLIAAVALLLLAVVLLRWRPGTGPPPQIRSLVVLPLDNLSGDPQQEYLSDGLTDDLTTTLAQVPDLRVISRTTSTHYKRTQKTVPEIARELGVDAVVEGSVARSGNLLHVNVQLIRAQSDQHMWASTYDRQLESLMTLQGELAREVAGQIRLRLSPEQESRIARNEKIDPEAYRLYLQGRSYWHERNEAGLRMALACFEEATRRDPNFAAAYAGMADVYIVMPFLVNTDSSFVYEHARLAAQKALQLDPKLDEAHNSEAYVRIYHDWDFRGAEQEFKTALAINPNFATAHQWYAELLSLQRRDREAIAQVSRALELDSQSAIVHHQAGQIYLAAGDFSSAMREYEESLKLGGGPHINHFAMYRIYRLTADYEKAMEFGRKQADELDPLLGEAFASVVKQYRKSGWKAALRTSLHVWSLAKWPTAPYYEAWDYVALGDKENALKVLEREYKRRNLLILTAASDPELVSLRSEPRFQVLMRKVGIQ